MVSFFAPAWGKKSDMVSFSAPTREKKSDMVSFFPPVREKKSDRDGGSDVLRYPLIVNLDCFATARKDGTHRPCELRGTKQEAIQQTTSFRFLFRDETDIRKDGTHRPCELRGVARHEAKQEAIQTIDNEWRTKSVATAVPVVHRAPCTVHPLKCFSL
jgi:hypothetical protein